MEESASDFDTGWKEALEWFFEPFMGYLFPVAHGEIDWSRGHEFLDKELQQVLPDAVTGRGTVDKLVKVWTAAGQETWVLIHVEVQSQHDAAFAERMYVYNYRLRDRYGRMPVSFAVLGDESRSWRPDTFREGRWRCEALFTFPTVKLLDYRGREPELEADPNPFAAVVLAHLKAQETRGDAPARCDWKLRLVKGLYERGLTQQKIRRLFNVIDWVMTLPPPLKRQMIQALSDFEKEKQMPLISPTEQMWLEDGRLEGRLEGLGRGIELGLRLRFGQPGLDLMPRVREIKEPDTLESLLLAIETAPDLDSLRALLPPQS